MKLRSRDILLAAFAIAIVGFVSYYPSLQNGFVWDDNYQIVRNPYLGADHSWRDLFTTDVWGYIHPGPQGLSNYYRPFQMLSYRLLRGDPIQPEPYHWLNLLLNILNGWVAYALIYLLCRRPWIALSGAILFTAHPIHSEAVFWISSLSELGCAFFYFCAFSLYLLVSDQSPPPEPEIKPKRKTKIIESPTQGPRYLIVAASAVAFCISLLWKEMAISLPLLVMVHAFVTSRKKEWSLRLKFALLRSIPYWTVLAAYFGLRFAVLGYLSRVQQDWTLTPLQFLLSIVELIGQYCLKLTWPSPLNSYYVFHPAQSITRISVLASFLFLVPCIVILVRTTRRWPIPSFAAVWVFITLVPVLNLRGVGQNVFTERYLYIPSLGFCILLCWLAASVLQRLPFKGRQTIGTAVLGLVVLASVLQVRARASDWQDDFNLFSSAVQLSPDSVVAHEELGQLLRGQKQDFIGADLEFHRAYDIASAETPQDKPGMARAMIGLAGIAYAQKQVAQSLEYVEKALAVDPTNGDANVVKGVALLGLGRFDEAKKVFEEAEALYPNDEVVVNGLGTVALAQKENAKAIEYFSRVTKINPGSIDAYNNLGRAWTEEGHLDQAIPAFRHAIELEPNRAMSHVNLGIALGRAGSFSEARSEFQQALAIDPSLTWAQQSLRTLDQMQAGIARRKP